MTTRRSVYFTGPGCIEIREERLSAPAPGEVQVETLISAISPGTEMLVYRGEFPKSMSLDATIEALGGGFAYPLKYGYATVGRVQTLGPGVPPEWEGRQ